MPVVVEQYLEGILSQVMPSVHGVNLELVIKGFRDVMNDKRAAKVAREKEEDPVRV
jgi:hypothetical protein